VAAKEVVDAEFTALDNQLDIGRKGNENTKCSELGILSD